MVYFIKRAFIISLLLISSAFATGTPESWDYCQSNKDIIQIKDSQGTVIDLRSKETLEKDFTVSRNQFDIVTIKDSSGETVYQTLIRSDISNYITLYYMDKVYFIPKSYQSPLLQQNLTCPTMTPSHSRSASVSNSNTNRLPTRPSEEKENQPTLSKNKDDSARKRFRENDNTDRSSKKAKRFIDLTQSDKLEEDPERSSNKNSNSVSQEQTNSNQPHDLQDLTTIDDFLTQMKKMEEAAYWRINPNQPGYLQVLNQGGAILYNQAVRTQLGKRTLFYGYLRFYMNQQNKRLPRDPNDKANIEENDFTEGSNNYYIACYGDTQKGNTEEAAYWRINPNQPGYFQVLDQRRAILYNKAARTRLGYRKLKNGYLMLCINKKRLLLLRDPSDKENLEENDFAEGSNKIVRYYKYKKKQAPWKANLEENDFAEGSNKIVRYYGQIFKKSTSRKPEYEGVNLTRAAYWRIDPDQAGYFQLCDKNGTVLHTKKVRTRKGERKIHDGYFQLRIKGKTKHLKRDPNDKADLEKNGFAAGSNAHHHCYYGETTHIRTNIRAANIEMAAYWRINPEQTGYLQLCDQDGTVLHTEPVMTHHVKRQLHLCKKHKGTLLLIVNKKANFFKRDPNDLTNLEKSGFAEGSDEFFRAYGKVYKKRSLAAIQSAAYWRIHPDQPRYLQLCDQDGTVLHTEEVITRKGERKISNGYLQLKIEEKQSYFKRDPKDTANLEENGFAAGTNVSKIKTYTANLPTSEDNNTLLEEEHDDAAIRALISLGENETLSNNQEETDDSEDELVIDEDLSDIEGSDVDPYA